MLSLLFLTFMAFLKHGFGGFLQWSRSFNYEAQERESSSEVTSRDGFSLETRTQDQQSATNQLLTLTTMHGFLGSLTVMLASTSNTLFLGGGF